MAPWISSTGSASAADSGASSKIRSRRPRARVMFWNWVQSESARRGGWIERPESRVQAASPPIESCPSITMTAPKAPTPTMVRLEKTAPRPWARLLKKVAS